MSPTLDMPLNRREAVTSLLAMLALVLGTSESGAAEIPTDSVGIAKSVEYLDPISSKAWMSFGYFFSEDADLPAREGGYRTWLEWEDGRLMLTVRETKAERTDPYLARFHLVGEEPGDACDFMDMLSERADLSWIRDQAHFLEHPRVHCRVCKCQHPASHICATCRGTGWITIDRDEAERIVQMRREHRGQLFKAAHQLAERTS